MAASSASGPHLTVSPDNIKVPSGGGTQNLTVTNPTDKKMVFKMKSSNNNDYRVKPVYGFIEPGKNVEIEILRLEGVVKEDRFVLEYCEAPADANTPHEAMKMVGTAPNKVTLTANAT